MRYVIGFVFLCLPSSCFSVWKIRNLVNNSDLKVVSASYTKPSKTSITYLNNKILAAEHVKNQKINMNYTVADNSKGCSLIDFSDGYYLSLDGYPSHSVVWARAKTQNNKKYAGKEVVDVHKHQYCARVFIEKTGDTQPLTHAAYGYNQKDILLDVIIAGTNGQYTVSLVPA